MKCELCNINHDGLFGSGRFCSVSCANTRTFTDKQKGNISRGVIKWCTDNGKRKPEYYSYVCEKCSESFNRVVKIRRDRYVHCEKCKNIRPHRKQNCEFGETSKRTQHKIIKRARRHCSICFWNESTCDIHHINKDRSDNRNNNLVVLCPNCHRIIHTTDKYSDDYLIEMSVEKVFPNWRKYYLK